MHALITMEKELRGDAPMKKAKVLANLVPPKKPQAKRKFIAVDPEAYDFITKTAESMGTTRGRVVTALVTFYRSSDDGQ